MGEVANAIVIFNSKRDAAAKRSRGTLAATQSMEQIKARREVLAELDARINELIGRERLNG